MEFHLFKSYESTHIDGKKEQTLYKDYEIYNPQKVYIPSVDNKDNELLETKKVGDVVKKGELLGKKSPDNFPLYSSISGKITEIKDTLLASGRVQKCFVIENDNSLDEASYSILPPVEDCSNEEIIDAIKNSGTIGFGGAGFPTYRKFNSGKHVDYLIVNAIECEPYLTTDYIYGAKLVDYLFKALPYLLKLTGAKEVAFCTKEDKPALINACLDGINKYKDLPVKLYKAKDKYPMGYERNLVTLVCKKEYQNIPIEAGCIVDNIYTYISMGRYFTEGKVTTDRCITVSGLVNDPKNVLTPYGVLASELIKFAGDISSSSDIKVINGGPMNGNTLPNLEFATLLQTNGITVLMDKKERAEPCWHCGKCVESCPMDLQPVQIQLALKSNDVKRMIKLNADRCCNCALCSYVCPSKIDVKSNVQKAKFIVMDALKGGK